MDYLKIAKDTFTQWWNNKYLWVVGIIGTVLSNLNFSYDTDTFQKLSENGEQYSGVVDGLGILAAVLGCLIFIAALIGIYLSYRANAGLIVSGEQIHKGKELDLKTVWANGSKGVVTLFAQALILFSPFFFLIVAAIVIIVILGFAGAFAMPILFVGVMCLICLMLPFTLAVSIISTFAARISLIKKVSAWEGIKLGWRFGMDNIGALLVFWLITLLVRVAVSTVLIPAYFIGAVILIGPASLVMVSNPILGVLLMIGGGLIISVITSLIEGPLFSLTNLYWTKVYLELDKA